MYIPRQTRATTPQEQPVEKEEAVETSYTGKVQADFIAPDLQALIDSKKSGESEEKKQATEASAEDWVWLRKERDKRLSETDTSELMRAGLSFEVRSELYKYRQALRDLPATLGTRWTRDSVIWPVKPS